MVLGNLPESKMQLWSVPPDVRRGSGTVAGPTNDGDGANQRRHAQEQENTIAKVTTPAQFSSPDDVLRQIRLERMERVEKANQRMVQWREDILKTRTDATKFKWDSPEASALWEESTFLLQMPLSPRDPDKIYTVVERRPTLETIAPPEPASVTGKDGAEQEPYIRFKTHGTVTKFSMEKTEKPAAILASRPCLLRTKHKDGIPVTGIWYSTTRRLHHPKKREPTEKQKSRDASLAMKHAIKLGDSNFIGERRLNRWSPRTSAAAESERNRMNRIRDIYKRFDSAPIVCGPTDGEEPAPNAIACEPTEERAPNAIANPEEQDHVEHLEFDDGTYADFTEADVPQNVQPESTTGRRVAEEGAGANISASVNAVLNLPSVNAVLNLPSIKRPATPITIEEKPAKKAQSENVRQQDIIEEFCDDLRDDVTLYNYEYVSDSEEEKDEVGAEE